MTMSEIRFGPWLPDAPNYKNPGCEVAANVLAVPGGYGPLNSLVGQSDTATGNVRGTAQFFDTSRNSVIVGGTDDRLFVRRSSITETTGLSSIGSEEAWDFAQFNDLVIATAANNAPQYLSDIDSDNTWSALSGSPPNAKRCAKVGEFLMLGNISGAPNRIQWSAFNNPTGSWTADRATQAGQADLDQDLGEVQAIVGGRYGVIFQRRGIQRLSYVGPPSVWRADIVSNDRGLLASHAHATLGHVTFFLAQDGFFITDGTSVQSIAAQRVNQWFFDNSNQSLLPLTHAAIDWQNETVFWAFAGNGSTAINRQIMYNWSEQRWTYGELSLSWLVSSSQDAVSIDDLDAIYGNLDAIPVSLDSEEFRSKDRRLAAFVDGASTSEYSQFTGTPVGARIETGQAQLQAGRRMFVSEVMPLIVADDWDASVTLLLEDNRGQRTVSATKQTGWSGFAPVRGEGFKVALRLTKPAGGTWSEFVGAQIRHEAAGAR